MPLEERGGQPDGAEQIDVHGEGGVAHGVGYEGDGGEMEDMADLPHSVQYLCDVFGVAHVAKPSGLIGRKADAHDLPVSRFEMRGQYPAHETGGAGDEGATRHEASPDDWALTALRSLSTIIWTSFSKLHSGSQPRVSRALLESPRRSCTSAGR